MKKQVKITESDLHAIVKNAVYTIFEEVGNDVSNNVETVEEGEEEEFNEQPTNDIVGEGKKQIKVSESQLKDIVKESVMKILSEGQGWNLFKSTVRDTLNGDYDDYLANGGMSPEEQEEYDNDMKNYISHSGDIWGSMKYYDNDGNYRHNNPYGYHKSVNDSTIGKLGRKAGAEASRAVMKARGMYNNIKNKARI